MLKTIFKKFTFLFTLTALFLGCTYFCTPSSYANDSQWSTENNCGFIGAFTDISQISNTYIDTSLSEPFQVFYNKGSLPVGTIVNADTDLYLAYSIIPPNLIPNIVSVNIPLTRAIFIDQSNFDIISIYQLYNGSAYSTFNGEYDLSTSQYDFWLNLYNFANPYWQSNSHRYYVIIIKIHLNDLMYIADEGIFISSDGHYLIDHLDVRFNSYQNITYPIYRIFNNLTRISRYFASDSKLNAEAASQEVIDSTLEDFTGEGSAAAKVSDSKAMKNVSGSIKSGLDTGASVSNATDVFSSSSQLWGWFTQDNYNNINNISSGTFTIYPSVILSGFYLRDSGSMTSNSGWGISNYYDLRNFEILTISSSGTSSTPSICFYDSNHNYIIGYTYNYIRMHNNSISIPSNASVVRFSISPNAPGTVTLSYNQSRKSISDYDIVDFYSMNTFDLFKGLGEHNDKSSSTSR